MREIKFRFWDKDLNKMCFRKPEYNDFSHKNIVPLQFIGLKDKNGADIYEGDILYFQTYEGGGFMESGIDCYAEVVYGQHNFTDTVLNRSIGFYLLASKTRSETSIIYWLKNHKATVIGNIHQNPELLK